MIEIYHLFNDTTLKAQHEYKEDRALFCTYVHTPSKNKEKFYSSVTGM